MCSHWINRLPARLAAISFFSVCWTGVAADDEPPLFQDLVERYDIGDPVAENPLRMTEGPKALAAGDLNGDGRADIVSGNLDGSLSVLLGLPEGKLSDQILHPAQGVLSNSSIRGVVVEDFNEDQKLDIAVADVAGQAVVIFSGQGDGTLQFRSRIPVDHARALDTADFDGDGHADLVVASSPAACFRCPFMDPGDLGHRSVSVLLGNGDGSFHFSQFVMNPQLTAYYHDVAAPDINGDGFPDILALNALPYDKDNLAPTSDLDDDPGVFIFLNTGDGTFNEDRPDRILAPRGRGARSFTLAYLDEPLNAEGVPPLGATLDVALANRDSASLDVYLNLDGYEWMEPRSLPAGTSPRDVAAADLDGNGWADLVVVKRDEDAIAILPGLGNGRFSSPVMEYPTGHSPRNIVLADVNGDGALDAAVGNRISEDVSIFIGRPGLAGFLLPEGYYPAGFNPVSVVAEDFNGDGFPDVATAGLRSHDLRVRLNLGQDNGELDEAVVYPVNYGPVFLAAADVNRDTHLDLVVTCMGTLLGRHDRDRSSVVTLLGTGRGDFQAPLITLVGDSQFRPYWLRLGDLSGDGILDVVVSGTRGGLLLLEGAGDGTFEDTSPVSNLVDGRPLGFALGDFDGNNWLDIATSRGVVLLNDGQFFEPTVDPPAIRTRSFIAGFQAWAVEAADLDDDGHLDLMVALTFERPDPIGVYFGSGDGTFTEPDVYEGPDVGAVTLWAADMDGDEILDIVVGNRCAATVIIMQGRGDRTFEIREIVRAYSVQDVAVADLNQDGRPDLVGAGLGVWPIVNGATNTLRTPRVPVLDFLMEREGPCINELMSQNTEFHSVNGGMPDWLEIYNHGPPQGLDGWSLGHSEDNGNVHRWYFPPGTTIDGWGYLVVYCEPGHQSSGLYADFRLSAEGEDVMLFNALGEEIDYVQFPALPPDVSYARFVDGARLMIPGSAPTIGSQNLRPGNVPPKIERKDPYVGPGGTSLGLTGLAVDDMAIAYVGVCYRLADRGDVPFDEMPLNDDGASGDKQAGDGTYGAILPSLTEGAVIEYFLRVVDMEGRVDYSPNDPDDLPNLHRVPVPRAYPHVRLVELMAANQSGLRDETGSFEDWLEVANTGQEPLHFNGLALLKDYFKPEDAWSFPTNLWLNPEQRLVVFCDNDPEDGPLHASFKLQRSGDRVFLVQTNEPRLIIDSLSFGPLPADTSFGVFHGDDQSQMLAWPTPGGGNLPMPPPPDIPGAAPHMFSRLTNGEDADADSFALRWVGLDDLAYRMEWSADFNHWTPSVVAPRNLGQGLFQWKDTTLDRSALFYRIQLDPVRQVDR